MAKIYTRTGDEGLTGLVSGNRISKSDERIDLYGDVDELNSYLGLVIVHFNNENNSSDKEILLKVQSALFDLGSNLACEEENRTRFKLPSIHMNLINSLESRIDQMDDILPKLKNFILPGGSLLASHLHVSRTICRRVERKLVHFKLTSGELLPENGLMLLNRLSDYLFVLSRYANHLSSDIEVEWKPFIS
ncbi:MAG: cob(I)yrinic acid a,c-diamide adenosyltransferase [Bacteriovoracaceae bacterium]